MSKQKTGYKAKNIDPNKVQMLATFGCSITEIARFFAVDESTIRNKFKDEIQVGKEQMKIKTQTAPMEARREWQYRTFDIPR